MNYDDGLPGCRPGCGFRGVCTCQHRPPEGSDELDAAARAGRVAESERRSRAHMARVETAADRAWRKLRESDAQQREAHQIATARGAALQPLADRARRERAECAARVGQEAFERARANGERICFGALIEIA